MESIKLATCDAHAVNEQPSLESIQRNRLSDNVLKIGIETGGGKMKEPSQIVFLPKRDGKMGAIFLC